MRLQNSQLHQGFVERNTQKLFQLECDINGMFCNRFCVDNLDERTVKTLACKAEQAPRFRIRVFGDQSFVLS